MQSYKKYEKLIYKIAHSFKNSGKDIDELIGYANMYFVRACHRYNADSGVQFSTFLTHVIRNGLIYETGKHKLECEMPEHFDASSKEPSQEHVLIFQQNLMSLSKEAQMVAQVIFQAPKEIADEFSKASPKKAKKLLLQYFTMQMGWKCTKTKKAFKEISAVLKPE